MDQGRSALRGAIEVSRWRGLLGAWLIVAVASTGGTVAVAAPVVGVLDGTGLTTIPFPPDIFPPVVIVPRPPAIGNPTPNFTGVLEGQIGATWDETSGHVLLDGTTLSWTGKASLEYCDAVELPVSDYSTDELRIGYRGLGTLTVRNGGHLSVPKASLGTHGEAVFVPHDDDMEVITLPPSGDSVIVVENAGSILDVFGPLVFRERAARLAVRDGGTLNCDSVDASIAQGEIVIDGDGSAWRVASNMTIGNRYAPDENAVTLAIRNGATLQVGSMLELERSAVLDVHGDGYVEIGDVATAPRESGVVRVGDGGCLWGDGRVEGRVAVEDGGTIGQLTTCVGPSDLQCSLEMDELDLRPGGRVSQFLQPYQADVPTVKVLDRAELHGTIDMRLDGYFPQLGTPIPLVEFTGTADTTGLAVRCAPWLTCTPTITPTGVSATLGLVGDGPAGRATEETTYLAGVIAHTTDEHTIVDVGPASIAWTDGAYLVTTPQDEPGYVYVGFGGEATMTIVGRTIQNLRAELGREEGSHGTVILDGPEACWEFLNIWPEADEDFWRECSRLVVGLRGRGDLIVRNGAALVMPNFSDIYLGWGDADDQRSQGTVTVEGEGSRMEIGGIEQTGGGRGDLRIANGGQVWCVGYSVDAYDLAQTAIVSVDGPGSLLKCDYDFHVNSRQTAIATVSRGGRVESMDVRLDRGYDPPPNPNPVEIVVDGDGSRWDNAERFELGKDTTLTVRNGGRVAAGESLLCDGVVDVRLSGAVVVGDDLPGVDGEVRIASGGFLSGDGVVRGRVVMEEGSQLHDERAYLYDFDGPSSLTVDSFEAMPGSDLWFNLVWPNGANSLECLGDARFAGTIHVEAYWDYDDPIYLTPGTAFDLVTVAGECDWTGATLAWNRDERIHVWLHEHGMSVRVGLAPEPSSATLLATMLLAVAFLRGRR